MLKTRPILFFFPPPASSPRFAFFSLLPHIEPLFPKEDNTVAEEPQALQIPIFPDDPILGDKKAGVTLIAFEDLGCAGCAEQHAVFQDLLEKYPKKLKIIWKPLPVTIIPYPSGRAHEYAYCANKQDSFGEFISLVFANQIDISPDALNASANEAGLDPEDLKTCLESGEAAAYTKMTEELGRALNIQSVPTIFLENIQIDHPRTIEGWETLLQLTQ